MAKILFVSNNTLTSNGLSGGDRILIELIKNWKKHSSVGLLCSQECLTVLKKYTSSSHITLFLSAKKKKTIKSFNNQNYFFHTLNRSYYGIKAIFKFKNQLSSYTHVYSASDFYPDLLPAILLKILYPSVTWIASFYLFAPKPWQKDNPYRSSVFRYLTGLFYWFTQLLSYFLIYHFANFVCVTSNPDVKKFVTSKRPTSQIIVVKGGVDITPSKKYLQSHPILPLQPKKFLAVFLGRLHFQKGVLELIDIWKYVCQKIPQAKLAIIGNGQLYHEVVDKITVNHLQNNIQLFGFLDGPKKFAIFKQSSIVVHPATYDSGGMAAAEAMAWGLPGVSFDLESLKTYYPQGMLKTKCFDLNRFASNIIKLDTNTLLYSRYSQDAVNLINQQWSWSTRSQKIYHQLFSL